MPWWYFHKIGGPLEGTRLHSVDPDDAQWNGFGPDNVLGCVVYPATEVIEPGVIKHIEGNRFSLGEPDGSKSERAIALSQALSAAGLKAPVRPKLRDEIWVKLWETCRLTPFPPDAYHSGCALRNGTRPIARAMMLEHRKLRKNFGVKFPIDVERRIDGGAAVGRIARLCSKTSIRDDLWKLMLWWQAFRNLEEIQRPPPIMTQF